MEREYFEAAKKVIDAAGFNIDEVREFLDDLRDRGTVNMYGSGEYLQTRYGFTRYDVKPIILDYLEHGLEDAPSDPQDDDQVEPTVRCQGCDWEGTEAQLGCEIHEIPHLFERVMPGEPMPIGECPECGALAHQITQEARTAGT